MLGSLSPFSYTLISSTIAALAIAWIAGDYFIGKYRKYKKNKQSREH
jgi:hypothetical protein